MADVRAPANGHVAAPSGQMRSGAEATNRGSAEAAYDEIRQAIIEGRYAPGQRLVEQRIAEEFNLSRTPVREALRALEADGLVITERNRGAIVRPITVTGVEDLYDLRTCLEVLAAERAAARADTDDIARLDEAAAAFDSAVPRAAEGHLEDTRKLNDANKRFHDGLLRAARHDHLTRLLSRTVDVPLVFQVLRMFDRQELERSATFHHLIRDAVAAGDPPRAGRLMTEHMLQGRDALLASLAAADDV